jgi:quinol monooxygenase YgiN
MLIAHVLFIVAEVDSGKALDVLKVEALQVRGMKGCINVIPFQDATNPQRIGIVHEWESAEDFTLYTASPEFARAGQALHPMMLEPPISDRFDANLIRSVD